MKKASKSFIYIIPVTLGFILAFAIMLSLPITVSAESANPSVRSHEMGKDSGYYYGVSTLVGDMCFGSPSAGTMSVTGEISDKTTFLGFEAYGVAGVVNLDYVYNNSVLCQDDANQWEIYSNNNKEANGISLGSKMKTGAIIVQKSADKRTWSTEHIVTNAFRNKNTDVLDYTPSEADLKVGTYYRVIVAYGIRHKTGSFLFVPSYEYKECVEVYEFCLAYDAPSSHTRDLLSNTILKSGDTVKYGFRVDDEKSGNIIYIKTPQSNVATRVMSGKAFYEPGVYTVTETTKLGSKYDTTITVQTGFNASAVQGDTYQSDDNTGYGTADALKVDHTAFGAASYTALNIVVPNGDVLVTKDTVNNRTFGIKGSEVYVLFKTNPSSLGTDWEISSDTWGGTDGQKVAGVTTGVVGTGAVVIQKSTDGYKWEFCADGAYENGIFTTDYENVFGAEGETCIYVPKGEDINKGYLYRVLYAYEARNILTNQFKNIIEIYTFKLIDANLDAITFHNLTLHGSDAEFDNEGEEIESAIAKATETLTDGALTVTGFKMDTTLNSAVDIKVHKNGAQYDIPADGKFTEDGKYEISISNELGSNRNITLYVSRLSAEEMYTKLFGDDFLHGKRIYSEGTLPVYEGELTKIHLNALGAYDFPAYITVINESTGKTYPVRFTDQDQEIQINDAGRYAVRIYTNHTFTSDTPSGDNHSFIFRFNLIAKGTAPGPVINKNVLYNEYGAGNNPSNAYPIYYGVSYLSASKGYITLAFANRQDAYDYVYNHEKGMVEPQPDGSYRYNGNFYVSQKEKYTSGWDLTDAIDFFTNLAIKEAFFDISDEFTYLTLTNETIASVENLRTLELDKSVVIFADENQRDALLAGGDLPLINSKKYAYLTPGSEGFVESGYHYFEFIKDENGYDSASVVIIDCNGRRYDIAYNRSVGDQLKAYNCPTGKITIEEKTVYGDTNTYEAIYIAEDDNTISFDLKYYIGEKEYTKHITSANNGEEIVVNLFYLDNVVDRLGDLGLIRIYDGKTEDFYSTDDPKINDNVYPAAGAYVITVVNRLGYKYTFNVKIETSNYYVVQIKGENKEDNFPFIYTDGDTITLPELTKYGYNHSGFKTEDGKVLPKEVTSILLKGHTVLQAVWEAKKFNVNLYVGDALYHTTAVAFGDSYELPVLSAVDGAAFAGWGDDLLNGTITIEEEGDIVLAACFKKQEDTDTDIGSGDSEDKDEGEGSPRSFMALFIIMAMVGVILLVVWLIWGWHKVAFDEPGPWIFFGIGLVLLIVSILLMIF